MTSKLSAKEIKIWSTISCGCIAANVGMLISIAFNAPEQMLADRLRGLLNSPAIAPATASAPSPSSHVGSSLEISSTIFCSVFAFVLATAACFAGQLSSVARLVTWLQLFVVTLLIDWFFFATGLVPRPLSFFFAVPLGGLLGYMLRRRNLDESKKESQRVELLLRNRELQEARLQMVKQDEVDRRLLAADLHDQVLNDLKILNQKFQSYRGEPSDENAGQIDQLIHQAMNGIRDVMDSLSPAVLEHLGFAPALEDCLRRASERGGGFKVRFKNHAESVDFSQLGLIEQVLLYRLVQECGTNICKHAQASTVKVSLEVSDNELMIRVADNGKGIPEGLDTSGSRGLRYMRQRGDLIGATIAWLPGENNKGTTVEIRMPLSNNKAQ